MKFGHNWSVPYEAVKPTDARVSHRKSYRGIAYDFSKTDEMKRKIDQYRPFSKQLADFLHVLRATLLHGEFVKIHPFIDRNGRTSRLLLNCELMKNGYTPIIIKKENRSRYYEVLDYAHMTMDYKPFLEFVARLVEESELLWLSLLE